MRALLDVNVLIALFDPDHVHHARAWQWFKAWSMQHGWASCPITQNGAVRVMSQPGYPNPLQVASVLERLGRATAADSHEFWPDEVSAARPLGTASTPTTRPSSTELRSG